MIQKHWAIVRQGKAASGCHNIRSPANILQAVITRSMRSRRAWFRGITSRPRLLSVVRGFPADRSHSTAFLCRCILHTLSLAPGRYTQIQIGVHVAYRPMLVSLKSSSITAAIQNNVALYPGINLFSEASPLGSSRNGQSKCASEWSAPLGSKIESGTDRDSLPLTDNMSTSCLWSISRWKVLCELASQIFPQWHGG